MSLNVQEIKGFLPTQKPYKKADAGGLYLLVKPNGSKLWHFKYRFGGKERKMPLGAFPEVGLGEARRMRDRARLKVADGVDPMRERKREKAQIKLGAENTFESVAKAYIDHKMVGEGRAEGTLKKARWFLELLKPAIGSQPLNGVDPQMMLAALRKLELKGNLETAKKCRSFASRVFRYGAALGYCTSDPTLILRGALITPKARHYAAILEPEKLGELLRAIDGYEGYPVTKLALQITPHIFVRPGELRHGEWNEIDLDKATWTIPAEKMKARRPHVVPLSRQVLELFRELQAVSGGQGYIFPAFHTRRRPMKREHGQCGVPPDGLCQGRSHGTRPALNRVDAAQRKGKWHPDAIERALAHGDSNAIRGVYNRGNYWDERVRMAQLWSDYLDDRR